MVREAREHLAGLGIDVDPTTRIGALPIGLQQLIELARVLFSGARIIILDEPTSALSPPEVERLFATLRKLRGSGRSIVFISHFLDDILRISDTVTIFRNGRKVLTAPVAAIDKRQVIERMIGLGHHELEESYTGEIKLDTRFDAPVVLEADRLTFGRAFRDVSLKVRAGEVLGIYGFMGCGQLELARALFGKVRADGTLRLDGKPVRLTRTSDRPRGRHRLRAGEPPRDALPPRAALQEHVDQHPRADLALSAEAVGRAEDRQGHIENLRIRTPGPDQLLGNLSGGNQQKVALAKWLTHAPKVLILSEPTRGMDVGAKDDVVRIVRGLRDQGIGVVVVSTEPETVLSLADRILVMKRGEIVREFAGETVSKDRLLEAA